MGALSPDGLVGEYIDVAVGADGLVGENPVMRQWVLSHQMGWWERLH